jgi:putative ABC transport system permease protein
MNFVALKMLTGDRAKYLGLIFSIAFATFLISQQASIFCGLMLRTASQIRDVKDADIWVMDRRTAYFDEIRALSDDALYQVRGVPGVEWAVRLFKGQATTRAEDGKFRAVILLGLDDATLVGVPHSMLLGRIEDLRQPDAVIIDNAGYQFFYPGEPLRVGRTMEMNDRRAVIVGICDASAPFATFPVMFTRYSNALHYVGPERRTLSFVLAQPQPGVPTGEVCARIEQATGLRATTGEGFSWQTIFYYVKNTGIPVNFGITIAVALIVGTVVAGQTFYIFTLENLKQFGALKAIGVTNGRLVGMIVLQAAVVAAIGYALGIAGCAGFFEATTHRTATRGFFLLWQIMAGTGGVILAIVVLASLLSVRKVLVLEPAIVFRG